MLNSEKLAPVIVKDIASNMGWEEGKDLAPYVFEIDQLSVRDAFDKYLTWHGIIGYADQFISVLDDLREAEHKG